MSQLQTFVTPYQDIFGRTTPAPIAANPLTLPGCTANTWLALDSTKKVVSQTLSGTANQIILTGNPGTGSTVASLPQDIATTSSPSFTGLTVSGLTASMPVKSSALKALISSLIDLGVDVTSLLKVANGGTNSSVALTNNKLMVSTAGAIQEGTSSTDPVFVSITATGMNASMPVKTDATKKLISSLISLTGDVSGICPIASGGTNSASALANGYIMTSQAGAVQEGTSSTQPFTFSNATNSTAVGTGAVILSNGGLSIKGDTYTNGNIEQMGSGNAGTTGWHIGTSGVANTSGLANEYWWLNGNAGVPIQSRRSALMQDFTGITLVGGTASVLNGLRFQLDGTPYGTLDFTNGWTFSTTVNLSGLTASLPLQLDGSKAIISSAISLSGTGVSGILPLSAGGSNANLTASNGGMVWCNATQMQILANTATSGQFLLSGSTATPSWSNTVPNISTFSNTTDASSISTGSLITSGGLGISKKMYIGSDIFMTGANAAHTSTGFLIGDTLGLANYAGLQNSAIAVGANNYAITQHTSGLTIVNSKSGAGGLYLATGGTSYCNLSDTGVFAQSTTTDASSATTGAITCAGGIGIAKKCYVGTTLNVGGLTASRMCSTDASKNVISVGFPSRATIWVHEGTVLAGGGTIANLIQATHMFDTYSYISTGANADSATWSCFLGAGTYTFSILGHTQNNLGIIDWYMDGATFKTGDDWYSAGNVDNVIRSWAVTVTGNGRHVIKLVLNGKNAASTNYFITLTKFWLFTAADSTDAN